MGKPIHPATVHFPIAFLSLAFGLDALNALSPNLPSSLTSSLPPSTDLTRASYYLLSLGLLTAIPAVTSGGAQAVKLIQKQGLYEADGKTLKEKTKATIAHAVVNDVSLAAAGYVWWTRRQGAVESVLGKMGVGSVSTGAAAYAPATWQVVVEILAMGLMLFGASIGGALTYNYGVGFAPAGKGAKKVQ